MQKTVQVIATYLATLSTAITAEICQVSYNCVTKYVELFQQKATLSQIFSKQYASKKNCVVDGRPTFKLLWDSTPQFIFENYKRYSQTISSLVHTRFPR